MGKHAGVLFDVDGTLLDTNYQHVVAWELAFRDAGHEGIDMADIHRLIGRSSEELVEELVGSVDEAVVTGHSKRYDELRESFEPRVVRGARHLVEACARRGLRTVLATSGSESDLEWMVPAIGAGEALHGSTTSSNVEHSKPAPDLLAEAARQHDLDLERTVMVGDTVWDVIAAERLGVPCVALTSGGIGAADLRQAGAAEVWTNTEELVDRLDESVIGGLTG